MIIVSQNKISVINFDNVTTIEVNKYNDKKYVIKAYLASARMIDLAIYETEKRAKEILKEITNTFSAAALNGTHDEIDLILKAKFMARYEMPKE